MSHTAYLYELRQGDEIVATGHVVLEHLVDVGERVKIAGRVGIAHSILPIGGRRERRLVVQMLPPDEESVQS